MRKPGQRILYILAAVAVLIATSFGMGFAAEWKAVNTGLTNLEIRSLAIDPASSTTLFAGTRNGLFKSLDGGRNLALKRIARQGHDSSGY